MQIERRVSYQFQLSPSISAEVPPVNMMFLACAFLIGKQCVSDWLQADHSLILFAQICALLYSVEES